MKIKLLMGVILAGCTFGFAKEKADVRDVTGCLSKGNSANEFLLTGMMEVPGKCGAVKSLLPRTWVIR